LAAIFVSRAPASSVRLVYSANRGHDDLAPSLIGVLLGLLLAGRRSYVLDDRLMAMMGRIKHTILLIDYFKLGVREGKDLCQSVADEAVGSS
jgi:hypothetical protein